MRPLWILVLAIVVGLAALALSAAPLLRRRRPLFAAAARLRGRQGEFVALAARVRALDADIAAVRARAAEVPDRWALARRGPFGRAVAREAETGRNRSYGADQPNGTVGRTSVPISHGKRLT